MKNEQLDEVIVVDARCLQDSSYKDRGIGKLATNILQYKNEESNAFKSIPLIGLVDPNLPALERRFSRYFDQVCRNAYQCLEHNVVGFIELSPMTHDPLFVGRLVNDKAIFSTAVVYDFIPLYEPNRYLPKIENSIDYHSSLLWMSRYSHFFAISKHTSDELKRIVGVEDRIVTKYGAPVEPEFYTPPKSSKRLHDKPYILACSGAEPRKNVECAIVAHAQSDVLRKLQIDLLITGHYPSAWKKRLVELYVENGGLAESIKFIGHQDIDVFVKYYQQAKAIIVPSRMEGFSIPVVEGIAAGVPVVASDIPAHQELLKNKKFVFDPDNYQQAKVLLERLVADEQFNSYALASQSNKWQKFQADSLARSYWQNFSKAAKQFLKRRNSAKNSDKEKLRLAILSPVPPDPSGVADYTKSTLNELGRLADVDLYTETVNPVDLPTVRNVFPLDESAMLSAEYDKVIGVTGNSHFHLKTFDYLLRYGGACIEHDARLLDFYWYQKGAEKTLKVAQAEVGEEISETDIRNWLDDEAKLKATFLGELSQATSPFIMHSPISANLVEKTFDVSAKVVPFSVYQDKKLQLCEKLDRKEARQKLGIEADQVVIATLGYIHENKRVFECVEALSLIGHPYNECEFHFVGGWASSIQDALTAKISKYNLKNRVHINGNYVNDYDYACYLLAADAFIQLRTHTFGGVSGAVLDWISVGCKGVVNNDMAQAMEIPAYVTSVSDRASAKEIAEALTKTLSTSFHASELELMRKNYTEDRSMKKYAEKLIDIIVS